MAVAWNPKDVSTFASAALDGTIKVWRMGSSKPNFTLSGHTKGVNAVAYYPGDDKLLLISGADDQYAAAGSIPWLTRGQYGSRVGLSDTVMHPHARGPHRECVGGVLPSNPPSYCLRIRRR